VYAADDSIADAQHNGIAGFDVNVLSPVEKAASHLLAIGDRRNPTRSERLDVDPNTVVSNVLAVAIRGRSSRTRDHLRWRRG
jgi:hypothetical protein